MAKNKHLKWTTGNFSHLVNGVSAPVTAQWPRSSQYGKFYVKKGIIYGYSGLLSGNAHSSLTVGRFLLTRSLTEGR